MIDRMRFSLRMLRYTHGKKSCIIAGACCFLLGLLLELLGSNVLLRLSHPSSYVLLDTQFIGGFLFCFTGFFVIQSWKTLNSSKMFASSPRSKASLCTIPTLFLAISSLGSFTILILLRLILHACAGYDRNILISGLYVTAFTLAMSMLYMTAAYYYYIPGILIFYLIFYGIQNSIRWISRTLDLQVFFDRFPALGSLPVALAICYAFLTLNVLLNYFFTLRLYKKPFSKRAVSAPLRKYL